MGDLQITHLAKKVSDTFFCEPPMEAWGDLIAAATGGELLGQSQREWHDLTRRELGLPVDRPVIATGHQTLLWHPGILAKYIARDAAAHACGFAQANLVVDQHVGDFGDFDVPVRKKDGSLGVMPVKLTEAKPNVPMALHPAFTPHDPPRDVQYALDSVADGVKRILHSIRTHADAPNAALQMSRALAHLMRQWAAPATDVTATALLQTSLGRALTHHMVHEPLRCAEAYNRAVAAVPEAGVPALNVGNEVELPLWRIEDDGERVRALAPGVERELHKDETPAPLVLMPRALFMTALVRLGLCDLFIHGTGGAAYDRAMELWIREWLGARVAPIAVVTADLRLQPLENDAPPHVDEARHEARHVWHDPQRHSAATISDAKRIMLDEIARLPRDSFERKQAFYDMHKKIEAMREEHQAAIDSAFKRAEDAARRVAEIEIAARRDWAFPLYPESSIDELAHAIRSSYVA